VSRPSWHLATGLVVAGWLLALVVVVLVHPFVPAPRWLMVHLLALGAVSNAILVWSWHFTSALLRLGDGAGRAGQARRLLLFNLGALAVVGGVVGGVWPIVVVGAAVLGGVAAWHAVALVRVLRRALPSRFGDTVRYYAAAGAALPVGVALGVLLARGSLDGQAHARLVVAHALVNLLGWVGLTVIGTLVTLWPTMLRTRIADTAERTARRALPVLLAGLVVALVGALAGSLLLTAAGVLAYLGGLALAALPHGDELRRKRPVGFPSMSVLAGLAWLAGTLVVLAGALATADGWSQAAARAGLLTAPLLAGFVAQVLLGALSYLVPVVVGGGPTAVRAMVAVLDRAAPARVAAANAGLLVAVLPVPSLVRVLCSVVVLVALASFLPLLVRAVVVGRRLRSRPRPTAPSDPVRRSRAGTAAAGLLAVLLAAGGGVAADPAAVGLGRSADAGIPATGRTAGVEVRVEGMRFVPDVVEVPAGDRLVVTLVNTGEDRHDLVLENGARTGRLAPGERAELDVGVVGRSLDGWCSVAGHRQMGMVLQVRVTGGGAPSVAAGHAHEPGAGAPDVDLMAEPGPGFVARDPVLPPAPAATTHRVTLEVREVEREVAPGVRQQLWTFGGTAPGPTLRGKVGDVFEVTLVNDGSIGHSVDFHAGALAPDGPMRTIAPGERLLYRFTATRSGIWLYHCATMPMSVHLANGMFGAVVIDPPDLAPVDAELLLVQSEVYLGPQGEPADAGKVADQQPDLVVFNGYAGQYDHRPVTARAGERVRVWVLAAGPNRGSAFHIVGGQFDTVYAEGSYLLPRSETAGSQVLGLTAAQGGFVELAFPEPGRYPFVTHVLSDAERGARGVIEVVG
jgi:nitrite reductase (NO-forming)